MISFLKESDKFTHFDFFYTLGTKNLERVSQSVLTVHTNWLRLLVTSIFLYVIYSPHPITHPCQKVCVFWENPNNGLRTCEYIPKDKTGRIHSYDKQSVNRQFYQNLEKILLHISGRCILGFTYK